MASIYTVKYNNKIYKIRGERAPTEQDMIELVGGQAPQTQTKQAAMLPSQPTAMQATEQKISQRPSQWQPLQQYGQKLMQQPLQALSPMGMQVQLPMAVMGGAAQSLESPIANVAMALQRGKMPSVRQDVIGGVTGERQGQLGDVMRSVGVPEPIAAATGMLGTMGLTNLATAGRLGGAVQKATGEIAKKAAPIIKGSAEKSYAKALGISTKTEKELGEKVLPRVLEEKPLVLTREGWKRAAERKLRISDEALESGYEALGDEPKIAVSPILDKIAQKTESLKVNNVLPPENERLAKELNKIGSSIIDIAKTDEAPLQAIRQYRGILDAAVKASKKVYPTTMGNIKKEAQRIGANIIRSEIAKQNPSIGKLNANFSFFKSLDDLLTSTAPKEKGVLERVGWGLGRVGGDSGYGVFINNLGKLLSDNVAWNSFSGSMKSRLADYLTKGNTKAANFLIDVNINPALRKLRENMK